MSHFTFKPIQHYFASLCLTCLFFFLITCKKEINSSSEASKFSSMSPEQTGITFQNTLDEGPNTNILMYEYFYNGGGVAVADFNNDGLDDIYFTSNMQDNVLYLNEGNLKFKDITAISGASGRPGPWKTGVTAVDINSDGLMDIFVSYSGSLPQEKRVNQLFVNQGISANGNPLFRDMAIDYGLNNPAYSNQAYFFDYDRDDDIDMLLLNHNPKNLPILNEASTADLLAKDDPEMGLRLFQQTKGKFIDVTRNTGINGSSLSYGLGIGISDMNNDGWPDFYVSNDYTVGDYYYINNKNGTFSNRLKESLSHTSQFSMGNDVADYNNDGLTDIFTLDMLPEDNKRQKLLMGAENHTKFEQNIANGFYYQYMRNMLHLNNGSGRFSEIGQMAGISNTDWSWSALLADYDNDGYKDLFVSNGYVRDYTNMDFIKYMENFTKEKGRINREDVLTLLQKMPASDVSNYIFKNKGDLTFENKTFEWGMQQPSNSNGAAYSDLDNDGDLDLIVNNINKTAFILRNNSTKNKFIQIKLKGKKGNELALGTKIKVHSGSKIQFFEHQITRGYLSSVTPVIHVGLADNMAIDSIHIIWPDQLISTLKNLEVNKRIDVDYNKMIKVKMNASYIDEPLLVKEIGQIHPSDPKALFRDFDRQLLLTKEFSHDGSCMISGDLNNDGLVDLFIGGSLNVKSAIYLQDKNGKFIYKKNEVMESDAKYHDSAAAIIDVDNDGDNDLIVASGGYHDLTSDDQRLEDRMYINNGDGKWTKHSLPMSKKSSKSCIATGDINNDGKLDIFIGGRLIPGNYPENPNSRLLINKGNGSYSNQDLDLGMITDAKIVDMDNDKKPELVIAGEWMPITVFNYAEGKLHDNTNQYFAEKYSGFWNVLMVEDINGDGKKDIFAGNLGLNSQLKASKNRPIEMNYGDFDKNGSTDPILSFYIQNMSYPYLTKEELGIKLPMLNKKYSSFESYSEVTSEDLFSDKLFKNRIKLSADQMKTMLYLSGNNKLLTAADLPVEIQFAPVHTVTAIDVNDDNHLDLLLTGNEDNSKIRLGKNEANHGSILINDGRGNFSFLPFIKTGMNLSGVFGKAITLGNQYLVRKNSGEVYSHIFLKN